MQGPMETIWVMQGGIETLRTKLDFIVQISHRINYCKSVKKVKKISKYLDWRVQQLIKSLKDSHFKKLKIMQKILLQGIFVKLDIRINSNQKFWAEAEQTTSLNSYCNTWIEGEWFKNLLTQKYFTKKFSYLKVFWPKIVLNQNFVWKMWKKKHLNLLKKHLKWFWMKKFVAQNMRGMKFVAHKVVFRTISPFLRNMWQKSVSDF